MKRLILSIYFLWLLAFCMQAQNTQIPSVISFTSASVRAIRTGSEVKGYFAYFAVDKKDSKMDNYVLQLYDENLNEVGQKKFTMPKTTYFADVQYDGNAIVAKYYDSKAKTVNFISYNGKGEETGKKSAPASQVGLVTFLYNRKASKDAPPDFLAMEGVGFVNFTMQKFKKFGFSIDFLSDQDIKKGWSYSSDKSSDKMAGASYLASSDNVLLTMTSYRDKPTATDFTYNILSLDIKTGKKIAEMPCGNKMYNYTPMGAYFEGDKYIVVGQFVKKGDNITKTSSLGLSVVEYDNNTGKVISEKYTLWKDGLGKFAEMKGSKLLDGGYIFFHKIVKAPNGNIVLVGEQFHRTANATAIVNAAFGGGYRGDFSKLVITDFLFLEMNSSYDVVATKKITKGASDFAIDGLDYLGANLAGYMANYYGGFDYNYTTFNDDKSNFSVVYTDYDKLEGSKKESYVGNVSYDGGKYSVDKVPYKRGEHATLYKVYPGKNGYFVLVTYSKKAKSLNLDLVKFNN